ESVGGGWSLSLAFHHGHATHALEIEQDGSCLRGWHSAPGFTAPLAGRIDGDRLSPQSRHPREGMAVSYTLAGALAGKAMAGTFLVGASGTANPGPVADAQFGGGTWTARRAPRP